MNKKAIYRLIVINILSLYFVYLIIRNFYSIEMFFNFLIVIGVLCNSLAIVTNNFKMPVKPHENATTIDDYIHKEMDDTVRFYYLCDIFRLRIKKSLYMYSVGDVLLTLGVFLTIISATISII